MRQPNHDKIEYERIQKYDEWVTGIIEEVKLEENRLTGFKDDVTGLPKRADMIRFKFKLDGHQYPHYSRWLTYSYGEKANLYLKYLKHLVEGAAPDMDFDLDLLKGFPIKTMWTANGDFDNLEQIRPLKAKFQRAMGAAETEEPPEHVASGDEIPF